MNRTISFWIGSLLILVGVFFALINFLMGSIGAWFAATWPVVVLIPGLAFALVPFFFFRERWTGVFFIPALPLLTTGGILMFASLTGLWGIWSWAWALEVLAVAVAFVLAAIFTRIPWLAIPAVPVGLNGLILFFCAVSGLWGIWAWAWGLEIVGVGGTILLVGWIAQNRVVRIVGWSFTGAGALACFAMMALIADTSRMGSLLFAAVLILGGLALIGGNVFPGLAKSSQPTETSTNP